MKLPHILKIVIDIIQLLQRTELRQLGGKFRTFSGIQRILVLKLGNQHVQKIIFAQDILALSAYHYGLVLSAGALGAIFGSLTAPRLSAALGAQPCLFLSIAIWGLGYSAILALIFLVFQWQLVDLFVKPGPDYAAILELGSFMMGIDDDHGVNVSA